MKIAIHNSSYGFAPRWKEYCEDKKIPFKIVNCYNNRIIEELKDCSALMWHHSQSDPKDILFAKKLLFSLQQQGKKVFPDFNTTWHFDDKVGQKYLLESVNAPLVPSYVFYNRDEAINWVENTSFPKVFKLSGGAGSANVKFVKNKNEAIKLTKIAFGKGFKQYDAFSNFKERLRKYGIKKTDLWDVVKGILRFVKKPYYSKVKGPDRGYIYFQDFIPDNKYDIRIIVIDKKAFALKRMVRKNEFRASGSGEFKYSRNEFDELCIEIAFETIKKLNAQCLAFDFVFNKENNPLIVEISYGFTPEGYDACPGYWDENLNYYDGKFNPYGWMVELVK